MQGAEKVIPFAKMKSKYKHHGKQILQENNKNLDASG